MAGAVEGGAPGTLHPTRTHRTQPVRGKTWPEGSHRVCLLRDENTAAYAVHTCVSRITGLPMVG
jgi:hypothetical protein